MSEPVFVIDTSALIDTVQPANPAWAEAYASILARHDLIAPLRIVNEIGNIVHRKHPDVFGANPGERKEVVRDLLRGLAIAEWREESMGRCADITEALGVTFYDATFLDLAKETPQAILVTQDPRLQVAAKRAIGTGRSLDLDGLVTAVKEGRV